MKNNTLLSASLLLLAFWLPCAQARLPSPPPVVAPGTCGKPTKPVVPVYPIEALRKAQRGWVLVTFAVSPEGKVTEATVLEASPKGIFDTSALAAVSSATFAPSDTTRVACQKLVEFTIGRWD